MSFSRLFRPLFHSSHRSVPVKRFTEITFVSFFSSNSTKMDAPQIKNILITGGTDGIGKEAVVHFAAQDDYRVTFTGRSDTKAQQIIDNWHDAGVGLEAPKFLSYDFSIDRAVVNFGSDVARGHNFDICVINHGVMWPNERSTVDGRNSTMMTNLVSSYMIAHQLIDGRADPERNIHFVFTTSMMITIYPYRWFLSLFNIFNPKKREDWTRICDSTNSSGWNEYMASKMGMATLASAITAAAPHKVTADCVHPGIVFTNLMSTFGIGRQNRARCLIGLFGTSLTAAGQHLVNAAEHPVAQLGRYWYRRRQHTLPTNDYSNVTIQAFNDAMVELRNRIVNDERARAGAQ